MTSNPTEPNKLLVLLIDGFKWDYFDKPGIELPGFKQLFKEGVKSEYLEPVFPSLSYPNYYSLMTGLYCEDHGMVGNYMYDTTKNEHFKMMENTECNNEHWWEGAEPFWITAVKQGKRTYMFEWSGGEFPNKGTSSTYSIPVKGEKWAMLPDMKRNIETAISLFKQDEIDMAGVFVAEMDEAGHHHEPNSDKLRNTIQEVDQIIKTLLDELTSQSLRDKVNVVIFSDHGMAEISESRTVNISEVLNSSDVKIYTDRGNMCNIWPHEGKVDKVYTALKQVNNGHIKVYKKEDIPDKWHYKNHHRVPPLTVLAENGWFILTPEYPSVNCVGFHGYHNKEQDMRGILVATGPGLYCEDHGMVGNYMYDLTKNEHFKMMENPECSNAHWWEGAEPFWITAVKQGKRTYMFEWSGGEFPNKGTSSTYSIPVKGEKWAMLPDMKRNIETAISLFKQDEIDMAGVFVAEIDESGHHHEPNSDKLRNTIQEVDQIIKTLLDELTAQSLRDKVNVVIFSDHGMAEISESRTVDISEVLNSSDVKIYTDRGNMCNIWPHEGKVDKVYTALKQVNNGHIKVYKKEDIPDEWHYKNHHRVPPLTVLAENGWFILTPEYPSVNCVGFHGYHNKEQDMRGIFMATGPDVAKNVQIGPVQAVDVYQVLCKLLHVSPLPHKGDWSRVKNIFV